MYISRIEFIILELSINNKLNNEHKVKKSERGKRGYRKRIMNKQEINEFIEKMEEVGDVWTEEQVNDVYGDSSFEDALADRQSSLDLGLGYLIWLNERILKKQGKQENTESYL